MTRKKKKNKFVSSKNFLFFASRISSMNLSGQFIEFKKNSWVKKEDLKPVNFNEKNISKILKLFLNTKYLWGGKTSKGIDCSALIQIYFYFPVSFCYVCKCDLSCNQLRYFVAPASILCAHPLFCAFSLYLFCDVFRPCRRRLCCSRVTVCLCPFDAHVPFRCLFQCQ